MKYFERRRKRLKYIVIALVIVLLLIVIYILETYNKLVKAKNKKEEAFSTMDVYLKKRWDLIPNLVETVKGYSNFEKETLEKLTELRSKTYDSLENREKLNLNNEISNSLSRIFAVAENYPELKASQNFMDLSNSLSKTEDEIANARKYYNATVKEMNNKVEMFPSNIVAGMFGFKKQEMFLIGSEEKENTKVEF